MTEQDITAVSAPLHIGFVLPSLAGGGAERVFLSLASSLLSRGYSIDLVLGRCQGPYRADLPDGLRLYHTRLWDSDRQLLRYCHERGIAAKAMTINPAAARDWLTLRRRQLGVALNPKHAVFAHLIARYLRRKQPRLLLSALPDADAAAIYALELTGRHLSHLIAIHANIQVQYNAAQREMAKALYPRADQIVAVSQGAGWELQQWAGLPAEKIQTIYNPVPAAKLDTLSQAEVTDPWFQYGQPPVILNIGRESPEKDHATLVAAFGRARQQRPLRLVIIGSLSPQYRRRLQAQAQDWAAAADLKFIDFDANPFRYLRRSAAFVLSSRGEALPMTLLEALACGVPIVSTDTDFGPREILDNGRLGKLTPVGDAPALAAALLETLNGDHPPPAALQRRAADFSPEQAADAYARLFATLSTQNHPAAIQLC